MDQSKLGALAALGAVGVALYFSKAPATTPGAPSTPAHFEGDGHDHGSEGHEGHSEGDGHNHGAETGAKAENVDLVGGVTALKTQDLRPGKGEAAKDGDTLSMNYKGSLLSGEVFDQSYGRGPFEFTLGGGQVIEGWDKGIKGMKVGGKRKLTIPASLGYGEGGSPPKIPGGATLVFEVELLKISKKSG